MWANITKAMGATDVSAQKLRFHTQTGGSTLTAQQPMNNIVRVSNQALAAVLGGTQSLHTNGYDEAISLPSEAADKIALRTQQIIAFETGVTDTVDPLAGSFFIEALTDEIENASQAYINKIDAMGGAVKAIEQGYMQQEIGASAYQYQQEIENGDRVLIGVNSFLQDQEAENISYRVNDLIRKSQIEKLNLLKNTRDNTAVAIALNELKEAANGTKNLMPSILKAVEAYGTIGEIADILRAVFGEYTG
jgi:methylmalonyl-CoA mutase N-terminal domain/subunit